MKKNRNRNIVVITVGLVSALLFDIALYYFRTPQLNFNSVSWKSVNPNHGISKPQYVDIKRLSMINDLVQHHLRLGMKRKDIVKVLGQGDMEDGSGEHGPMDVYFLINPGWTYFFSLRQVFIWLEWHNTQPTLDLEYGGHDNHLISLELR